MTEDRYQKLRKLDEELADLLGYKVLGVAKVNFNGAGRFEIPFHVPGDTEEPLYLDDCMCSFKQEEDLDYFGHCAGCLEVVPMFSSNYTQCFDVVRRMKVLGWSLYLTNVTEYPKALFLRDELVPTKTSRWSFAASIPEAVCWAAFTVLSERRKMRGR